MSTVEELKESLMQSLAAASEAPQPLEEAQSIIGRVFSDRLSRKIQDDWLFMHRKEEGRPLLAIKIIGPGKFRKSRNHHPSGISLVDYGGGLDCSVEELADVIIELAMD
jgi:hypothetical protein